MPQFLFLDTEAYEAESFNTESTRFKALARHLKSGRLRLVITDITKIEVHKRIDKTCKEELNSVRKTRNKARVLRSANQVQDLGLFSDVHPDAPPTQLRGAVDKFLDDHDTTVVEAMAAQNATPVFERYFAMTPPFGLGSKRKEFPDAFVVEALIDWTNQQAPNTLLVVSEDVLFRTACQESECIEPVATLGVLLDRVSSEDAMAAFLRTQIIGRLDSIKNSAKEAFESLGFYVIDEDGDVELEVTQIDPNGEPDLIDISETEVTAALYFDAQYTALLSYDDSSTGTYDREEGGLVFMDHVTDTVHSSEPLTVTVTAVFDGTDTDRFAIHDIDLAEPSVGFGIPSFRNSDR